MFRVLVCGFAFSASTLVAEGGLVSQQPSETIAELDENLDLSVAAAEDEDFEDEVELLGKGDTVSNEGSRQSWGWNLRRRRRRIGQAWDWTRRRAPTPRPTPRPTPKPTAKPTPKPTAGKGKGKGKGADDSKLNLGRAQAD